MVGEILRCKIKSELLPLIGGTRPALFCYLKGHVQLASLIIDEPIVEDVAFINVFDEFLSGLKVINQ